MKPPSDERRKQHSEFLRDMKWQRLVAVTHDVLDMLVEDNGGKTEVDPEDPALGKMIAVLEQHLEWLVRTRVATEQSDKFKELVKQVLDEWELDEAITFTQQAFRISGYGAHWETGVLFLQGVLDGKVRLTTE